jgi:hypothetical protein
MDDTRAYLSREGVASRSVNHKAIKIRLRACAGAEPLRRVEINHADLPIAARSNNPAAIVAQRKAAWLGGDVCKATDEFPKSVTNRQLAPP